MKFRAFLPVLLLAAAVAAAPFGLAAQAVPVGEPFTVCSPPSFTGPGYQLCNYPDAAALASGRLALAWARDFGPTWDYSLAEMDTRVSIYAPSGERVAGTGLASGRPLFDYFPYQPVVAPAGAGGYVGAWILGLYAQSQVRVQRFGPDDEPLTDEIAAGEPREGLCSRSPAVDGNARGQFVVAWEDYEDCGDEAAISVQAFGAAGVPRSPRISISPDGEADVSAPTVGIDPVGRFVVLWRERSRETGFTVLRGQRFGRDGRLLGIGFTVPLAEAVSILPDGGFVVAWRVPEVSELRLWRFAPDGQPASLIMSASWDPTAVVLDLATDSVGNVAVLAHHATTQEIRAHLFNRSLIPQEGPIRIAPVHSSLPTPWWNIGTLALSDAGGLLIAWNGPRTITDNGFEWVPLQSRVWRVLRDDDVCLRRRGLFLCDTAGSGARFEAIHLGTGGEPAMLADWDGDGRDDPCVYRRGRFLCKTDHESSPGARALEFSPRIGQPGDQPFLGDLTGDGRADPCVRRGSVLLCDWRRIGNPESLRIDFGLPGDTFLLGDPDGDGRDDPCLFRDGRFLCDTAHDGGDAEVELDMITTWTTLGGTPLLGDVNGDGRDEACLWHQGRLECGVFSAEGGLPLELIERTSGPWLPGDVPLLGDLDAF
jgi:hypothetical protein